MAEGSGETAGGGGGRSGKFRAQYATGVTALALVCFALSTASVALPLWGYYENPDAGPSAEKGYFGPWQICKYLLYERKKCGVGVSRFKPVGAVQYAGFTSVGSTCLLALFSLLSVLQLAMVVSKEKILMPYSFTLMSKLTLALLSTLLSIVSSALFALQTDDRENDFVVTRGESFYIQIVLIVLTFGLFVGALYDVLFTRRLGGDPTMSSRDPSGEAATTYNNPGFKERKQASKISMTEASGKPYARGGTNGSMGTLSTTLSSNGSTTGSMVSRSPLRSSLKKPRSQQQPQGGATTDAPGGLGIHNPGFSGTSPTPSRNGSVKRVRIQTNSTAV